MKALLPVLLIFTLASAGYAMTVDEIVKLSKMKTSDELILKSIQKSGLDHPLTSKEVVYLKEQGVSEKIISYLLNDDQTSAGKSTEKSDKYRVYYKTDKKGKKVRVVTNIDERGHRMGGELPPEARQPAPTNYTPVYEPPREIYVTVRQEPPPQQDEEYQEPPPSGGIPMYDSYYPGYYPSYPLYPNSFSRFPRKHCCNNFINNSNPGFQFSPNGQANWNFDAGYSTRPRVSPPRPQTAVPGSSSGLRRSTH